MYSMGDKLPGMLSFLLIILQVFGSTDSCSFRQTGGSLTVDCRNGGYTSVPQNLPKGVTDLWLQNNLITTLDQYEFSQYASLRDLRLENNPWQCDCRMVPFRVQMSGSQFVESRITCEGPSNFHGQTLSDISTEDLMSDCVEPTILRFEHSNSAVEGQTLNLICEASGTPTPHITVTLPSGVNVTVESGGRVTVDVNGTITITNFTVTADAGLYVCIAESFVSSTSTTLSVVAHMNIPTTTVTMAPVTSSLSITDASSKPESSSTDHESDSSTPTLPFVSSTSSKQPETNDIFSQPVLVGYVCGAVAGTVLLVTSILTILYKNISKGSKLDEEEYDDVLTPSQRPHTDNLTDHREHEYEVIPACLPPRDVSDSPGNNQNVSAAVHGADNPQVVMDEDEYDSVKDGPQPHKYENSQVIAAVKDVLAVPSVISYENDDESATGKDDPQSRKYENKEVIAAAQNALAVPSVISYENEGESVTGKDDPQSHKYENSQVAAAKDPETAVQVVMDPDDYLTFVVTEKDQAEPNKYQNSQMIAAAKDAVAVPRVISYENDDETADNQTQADCQNDPATVHGADNPNHYQQLRKETLEQHHTYTSLLAHDT